MEPIAHRLPTNALNVSRQNRVGITTWTPLESYLKSLDGFIIELLRKLSLMPVFGRSLMTAVKLDIWHTFQNIVESNTARTFQLPRLSIFFDSLFWARIKTNNRLNETSTNFQRSWVSDKLTNVMNEFIFIVLSWYLVITVIATRYKNYLRFMVIFLLKFLIINPHCFTS